MTKKITSIFIALVVLNFIPLPKAEAVDLNVPFRMIDSAKYGIYYAYAPAIIQENGLYHMFYCSIGDNGAWDYIRYSSSNDGVNWSDPVIKLTAKPKPGARDIAACDPSIIYWQGYYYLFYSSYANFTQTNVQVARSATIDGIYATYTDSGQWVVNPTDDDPPAIVIKPRKLGTEQEIGYGAGQTSMVVLNNKIWMFYSDTSLAPVYGSPNAQVFMMQSDNPVVWDISTAQQLQADQVPINSNEVKYDDARGRFFMYRIDGSNQNGYGIGWGVSAGESTDGIHWKFSSQLLTLGNFIHNSGMASDKFGHMLPGDRVLFGFAGPKDLNTSTDVRGNWDLYGIFLDSNPLINKKSVGYVDGVSTDGQVLGWVYDPDQPSSPEDFHIYIDGPAGSGVFAGLGTTSLIRPDVNQVFGIDGNHGFSFTLPNKFRDGKSHSAYVYAIDSGDSTGGSNILINGSPASFTLSVADQAPVVSLDSADCDLIGGWAFDPDVPAAAIQVDIYDGMAGSGVFLTSFDTFGLRQDVNDALGITGNHGFTIPTPKSLKDGKAHTIYAYGINNNSAFANTSSVPKTITCSITPTPTPTPTPAYSDGTLLKDGAPIYIVEYGLKRPFVSMAVFNGLGFKLTNVIAADTSSIPMGSGVFTSSQRHSRGTLVLSKGTVYFEGADLRYPFPSAEIFLSWGHKFEDVVSANSYDLKLPQGPLVEHK